MSSKIRALGLLVVGLSMLCAGVASATPLGLQPGDTVTQLEWDSLQSVGGDGGMWDVSSGIFHSDGRVTSVQLQDAPFTRSTTADMRFDLDLVAHGLNTLASPIVSANAVFAGAASVIPDFIVNEGGVNILFGNFSTAVILEGNVNLADPNPQTLLGVGKIQITGGDPDLVAALGGIGGNANLLLTASIFGFNPGLATLAGDGNLFSTDFNVSLSGTLIPLANSPFVPEPGTAVLLGAGLVGLLAAGRRFRG